MADTPPPDDCADDVLQRADALLKRHRPAAPSASADSGADIPTLTDIVIEGEVLPRTEPPPEPLRSSDGPAASPVMSRVQAQNIEHAVHLRVKRGLNDQIAKVVEQRYMPEIGAALEQA